MIYKYTIGKYEKYDLINYNSVETGINLKEKLIAPNKQCLFL